MKGFSILKGRWWALLVSGAVFFLLLPIVAGAQGEGAEPPEEPPPVIEEVATEAGAEAVAETEGETTPAAETPSEAPPPTAEPVEVFTYNYFILHSIDPDLPIQEWNIIASIPANTSFTYEEPGYFGFFMEDPIPEPPPPNIEPQEPEKPIESDYPDEPKLYKEALAEYEEQLSEYKKDHKGWENYQEKYPQLQKEYDEKLASFNEKVYPELEHYYFFIKSIPDPNPKKAIYKLTITQAEKPQEVEDVGGTREEPIVISQATTPYVPVSITPPLARPDDLVLPENFWIEDRANDKGDSIALRWNTTLSDKITTTHIPEPVTVKEPEEKPEYDLNKFIVDAWVYAIAKDDKKGGKVVLVDPDDLDVAVDLSPLDGEKDPKLKDPKLKDSKLEFVGIVDNPDAYDYGLGAHFRGTFTIAKPKIGKYFIRATAKTPNKVLRGKVRVRKIAGEPVIAVQTEAKLPDMRYKHYFKMGMDYWDHEGHPRWILKQDPPLGMVARVNPLNLAKWNGLLYGLLITFAILFFIYHARKGKELFVRRIAGLDHVEEAIGRATEMGKPILFVPGIGTMADVATIAAMNILGQVSRKVAEYDSRILVPNKDPIVMTVAQETCQEAYIDAGHPDKYRKDDVFFLTDDQFSFAAAVDGIMVREKPATILLMGMFYAESLILAETGASTGAVQIAGTDALHQLPFFVTACDYTLIGEELYAASAYLSREPLLLGSLKGQDLAKLVIIILVFIGVILATFGIESLTKLFSSPL